LSKQSGRAVTVTQVSKQTAAIYIERRDDGLHLGVNWGENSFDFTMTDAMGAELLKELVRAMKK
jgi:hypothetical protein